VSEGTLGAEKCVVLKPLTFMNESGQAVGEAMRFLNLESDKVIVIYDEIDLLAGKVRVKLGGGAAGHNGIRSISAHISPHYTRVRLGVGHPGDKNLVHPHVLSDFAKADKVWLLPLLDAVADYAPLLVEGGEATFQNKVHLALAPAPEKD
ncbi:MAG: aminoacyl-tRNA hydrolase, partial [Aestuariivirga sp.]